MRTYNQLAGQKIQRIEALSDGVFAIALTLLVLDIKVPSIEAKSEEQLLHALTALAPKFLSYFLSFMMMGIFYTGQAAQLSLMEKYDRNLNWNTLFFLLMISLLPFTTAFLSEYIQFKLAIALYWLNILLCGTILYLHWNYAFRNNYVNIPEHQSNEINKAIRKRIVVAQTLYLFGALLCFISTYLSIGFIIVVQLNYAFAFFAGKNSFSKKEN